MPFLPRVFLSRRRLRPLLAAAGLAALSACASQVPSPAIEQQREAAQYAARAARDYTPPGPSSDPWGPYVSEASRRFDVPERWIREVMHVESGGQEYANGSLTTSPKGAMGLMQVMPQTYDLMRAHYGLAADAYDPHNNILAGVAYMREMYDLYGMPGFLAAYNAGPQRLDDYLTRNHPLPDETRRYVAMIGPYIRDSSPEHRAPAEQLAVNQIPVDIPPGPRYPVRARAYAQTPRGQMPATRSSLAVAALPVPPLPPGATSQGATSQGATTQGQGVTSRGGRVQSVAAIPPRSDGFRLISTAAAASLPVSRAGGVAGHWAIQVGAFSNETQARAAAAAARFQAPVMLGEARPSVGPVRQAKAVLYRARLTGLSREAAISACETLSHGRSRCIVLSPDAQS